MNNKDKIGGRAYKNGVKLKNNRRAVKAYYDKNDNLKTEIRGVKQNKYLKYIKKIPVLRGIAVLFLAILSFLIERSWKIYSKIQTFHIIRTFFKYKVTNSLFYKKYIA